MIDDYWYGAAGGLLIGLASVLMLYLLGRIAGISGLLWQASSQTLTGLRSGRIASIWQTPLGFIGGLLAGGALAHGLFGIDVPDNSGTPPGIIIVAGLLVGFGTRLGSGCTSGHGVCGIARLSPRSILATLTFMTTAAVTVFIVRHAMGA